MSLHLQDIKPLLDLTCAKVASMIKGKTAEESMLLSCLASQISSLSFLSFLLVFPVRKTFNIVNDFTPVSLFLFEFLLSSLLVCVSLFRKKKKRFDKRTSGPKNPNTFSCLNKCDRSQLLCYHPQQCTPVYAHVIDHFLGFACFSKVIRSRTIDLMLSSIMSCVLSIIFSAKES